MSRMQTVGAAALGAVILSSGCASSAAALPFGGGDGGRWVDLIHPLNEDALSEHVALADAEARHRVR